MAVSPSGTKSRAISIAALLLLSLFWALENLKSDLLSDLVPETLPFFARHTLPLILLAAIGTILARMQGAGRPHPSAVRRGIWIGLSLFAIPAILVYFSRAALSGSAMTALFCLVPITTAVFQPHLGVPSQPAGGQPLAPAMIALLGALLVFPVPFTPAPARAVATAAVILASASIGIANCLAESAITNRRSPGDFAAMASMAGATAAATLAAISLCFEHTVWISLGAPAGQSLLSATLPLLLWSAFLELPALLLLFWLMARMAAIPLSTRYVLAPWTAVLVGTALLHAGSVIQPRTWCGLLLMVAGAAYLLLRREAPWQHTSLSHPTTEE